MAINYQMYPGKNLAKKEYIYNEKEPIISIITPYYNSEKYIDETAEAVLKQTFPFFEWLIINDGSTKEESLKKLEEIKKLDPRIKVIHKENGGVAETRDYGVEQSNETTKYLFFLDSDDLINPTFLECAYWTLETNPKASWAYCDTINFGGANFTWSKWYNTEREQKENLLVVTALVKKEDFLKVKGFELRGKNLYEDWYLWLKMMKSGMFPVRMSYFGFWYRQKPKEESELQQSNSGNREEAMSYIKEISKEIEDPKEAIQYPKQDYDWDEIIEEVPNIMIPRQQENKKTKILMIVPWMITGGADKFNLDLIKRINKEKYEIIVVSTEPNENPWRQDFEENAIVYDLTTFIDRKYWTSFINYLIKSHEIDIVLNTNSTYGYAVLPYLRAKNPDLKIMDYIHMEEWYNRNGGFSRDSSGVSSAIDHTYVCNKNSEKILVDYFKKDSKKVDTIYIGVDEKKFDPTLYNKEEILKELKIEPQGRYIISFICRIAEQKRPYLLLEVIAKLKERRNDFLFVIAGDGPMLAEIKTRAKRLKIKDNIIFLGNQKETEKIYAISDLTMNCSIKEGLALTAYESLSMGVPVISADVGGQKELIDDKTGVIVPCLQDETEIRDFDYSEEEINYYVDGTEKILKKLEEYKSNCRKRILDGFTIDNMIENMEKAFDDVLQEKNEKAECLKEHMDITKELITKYFISTGIEYEWLVDTYNKSVVDRNLKYEKHQQKMLYYEKTLEYKIKHPIVVALRKLGIYEACKKLLRRGE